MANVSGQGTNFISTQFQEDGNEVRIKRVNSIIGVEPSILEIADPVFGDTATVILADGTTELWSHDGSIWTLDTTLTASLASYAESFVIADWVLNSPSYNILIPQTTHNVDQSNQIVVIVQENNGTDWVNVTIENTEIDITTGDVVLGVSEDPDSRFDGRVIIF